MIHFISGIQVNIKQTENVFGNYRGIHALCLQRVGGQNGHKIQDGMPLNAYLTNYATTSWDADGKQGQASRTCFCDFGKEDRLFKAL